MIDWHGPWCNALCSNFCFSVWEWQKTHTHTHTRTHTHAHAHTQTRTRMLTFSTQSFQLVAANASEPSGSQCQPLPTSLSSVHMRAHLCFCGCLMKGEEMGKLMKRLAPEIGWADFPSAHQSVPGARCSLWQVLWFPSSSAHLMSFSVLIREHGVWNTRWFLAKTSFSFLTFTLFFQGRLLKKIKILAPNYGWLSVRMSWRCLLQSDPKKELD